MNTDDDIDIEAMRRDARAQVWAGLLFLLLLVAVPMALIVCVVVLVFG